MRKNLTVNKNILFFYTLLSMLIVGALIFPSLIEIGFVVLFVIISSVLAFNAQVLKDGIFLSHILGFPIFISAFQNIYLGIAAYRMSSVELQVLLSLHIFLIFSCIFVRLFYAQRMCKKDWFAITIVLILLIQALLLYGFYPTGFTAFMASFRNIVACISIYWFAVTFGKDADILVFLKIINTVAIVVVIFGIFEWAFDNQLWNKLNITKLWDLKGIKTNTFGIPPNWYSSEKIGGKQIRRMVSTFADPVNLGTYLFAAYVTTWYQKKIFLSILILACIFFTVSKGAFLGLLIFIVIYTWFKDKTRIIVALATTTAATIGILFLSFSSSSSTGSLFLHVSGFFSSFGMLLAYPFGSGVGRVGVLSSLFSSNFLESSVTETGIGMIIAQLGFIGIISYIIFFSRLFIIPIAWKESYKQEKIVFYSLLISFLSNAMFNEVALSPNSCMLYFLILGMLVVKIRKTNL